VVGVVGVFGVGVFLVWGVVGVGGLLGVARDMLDRLLKQIPADAPQRAAIEARRKGLE
jgi:hypothetical protein